MNYFIVKKKNNIYFILKTDINFNITKDIYNKFNIGDVFYDVSYIPETFFASLNFTDNVYEYIPYYCEYKLAKALSNYTFGFIKNKVRNLFAHKKNITVKTVYPEPFTSECYDNHPNAIIDDSVAAIGEISFKYDPVTKTVQANHISASAIEDKINTIIHKNTINPGAMTDDLVGEISFKYDPVTKTVQANHISASVIKNTISESVFDSGETEAEATLRLSQVVPKSYEEIVSNIDAISQANIEAKINPLDIDKNKYIEDEKKRNEHDLLMNGMTEAPAFIDAPFKDISYEDILANIEYTSSPDDQRNDQLIHKNFGTYRGIYCFHKCTKLCNTIFADIIGDTKEDFKNTVVDIEPKIKFITPEPKVRNASEEEIKALLGEIKAATPEIKFRNAFEDEIKAATPEIKAATPEIEESSPAPKITEIPKGVEKLIGPEFEPIPFHEYDAFDKSLCAFTKNSSKLSNTIFAEYNPDEKLDTLKDNIVEDGLMVLVYNSKNVVILPNKYIDIVKDLSVIGIKNIQINNMLMFPNIPIISELAAFYNIESNFNDIDKLIESIYSINKILKPAPCKKPLIKEVMKFFYSNYETDIYSKISIKEVLEDFRKQEGVHNNIVNILINSSVFIDILVYLNIQIQDGNILYFKKGNKKVSLFANNNEKINSLIKTKRISQISHQLRAEPKVSVSDITSPWMISSHLEYDC